jgi:hypothetical protein
MTNQKSAIEASPSPMQAKILKDYLSELSVLLGRQVTAEELSLPSIAVEVAAQSKSLMTLPSSTFTIPFTELSQPRFRVFIENLAARLPMPVMLFTPSSRLCGFIQVPSVNHINFQFPFDINSDGILSFIASDLSNRLLFDFFKSSSGVETVQIEIEGVAWQVAY